jgi:DNA-binding PadR family transcriptional regulator
MESSCAYTRQRVLVGKCSGTGIERSIVAKRRKVANLLAVPVMTALWQQPMYPYQIAKMLRDRGKDRAVTANWGSFYTVIRNLEKNGFIEAVETVRDGNQPERTVYRLTGTGREELLDWLSELIGEPEPETDRLEAGLSDFMVLHPDKFIDLLTHRLSVLEARIVKLKAELDGVRPMLPRLFLLEAEYHLAMEEAQAEWVRCLLKEIESGTMPDIEGLRQWHETGEIPPEYAELFEREARKYENGQ